MHRHSFDLIAEYANGSLEEDAKARALVASCDDCRTVYEQQKSAIHALQPVQSAAMAEHEKAALHRDLWTTLRNPEAAPTRVALPWWRATWALGTATVLVIGVGLFGVLSNLGGGDAASTQVISEVGSALDGDERTNSDAAGEDLAPAAETTSTAAVQTLGDLATFEDITRRLRDTQGSTAAYYSEGAFDGSSTEAECIEAAGLVDYFAVVEYLEHPEFIVAVPADSDAATTPVAFVDRESCTILHKED